MELALITVKQVTVLFILIFSGYLCVKLGVLKLEWKQAFSNVLLYMITPCLIINSYFAEFNPEIFNELINTFLWSFVLLVIGIAVTMISSMGIKDRNRNIIQFACSFSNAAYMGFPLIGALFGNIGLLYASAFFTVFNILLWTFGFSIVSGKVKPKQVIKSIITQPAIISVAAGLVIYLGKVPLPEVVTLPISNIASMNTPLSMIITGMIIASMDFKALFKNKYLFFIIFIRMVAVPAICFALFAILRVEGVSAKIVLLLEACPTAAISSVFAVQFGYDEQLTAGAVVVTTLLSIITLPVMALAMTTFI